METAEADRIDDGVGMDELELNDDMSETTDRHRPGTSTSTTKPETKQPKRSLKTRDDFKEEANAKQPKESNNKNKMSRFKNSNYSQVKRRTNNLLKAGSNKRDDVKPTWHDKEIDESNPQIKNFKPPTKRNKEDASKVMKEKLERYVKSDKLKGKKKEKKRFERAKDIFIAALERNHSLAPEDMRRLLKPWIGVWSKSGIYILGDDVPKVGDAGDLHERVIGRDQQGTPFIFMFTDELIESGFISQDDVDALYDLGLLMFQGHHPDKEDYSKDKICRQLAEAIIYSIYDMKENPIAEFVMQIPSGKVRWVSSSKPAFKSIADLGEEDKVKLLKWIEGKSDVLFLKTWATIVSELEKDDKVEYFLKPKPRKVTSFSRGTWHYGRLMVIMMQALLMYLLHLPSTRRVNLLSPSYQHY